MKSKFRSKQKPALDDAQWALQAICHVTGLKPEKGVLTALLHRQAKKGLK